jgi:hypothetical protein
MNEDADLQDADLILALWETLSRDEQRELKPKLKSRRGRDPEPTGRSMVPFHVACRRAAIAVLKVRRQWREDNWPTKDVPDTVTRPAIEAEIQKSDILRERAAVDTDDKVYRAIYRRVVNNPERVMLTKQERGDD